MFFWYVGVSIVLVHQVFRSSGLDYRLVAAGALLPLVVDVPFGHMTYGHAFILGISLLVLVMIGTIGRSRLLRRRLLCLPIGVLCGFILSGAFFHDQVFLWPLVGGGFGDVALLPPLTLLVLSEGIGIACIGWMWGRFGLGDTARRSSFLSSGRLSEVTR